MRCALAMLLCATLCACARAQLGAFSLPLDGSASATVAAAVTSAGQVCLAVTGAAGSAWPGMRACMPSGLPVPSSSSCASLVAAGGGGSTGGGPSSGATFVGALPATVVGCTLATTQLNAAVNDAINGACAKCASTGATPAGAAAACAAPCPGCVQALVDWLTACATETVVGQASAASPVTLDAVISTFKTTLQGVCGTGGDCFSAFITFYNSWTAPAQQPSLDAWLTPPAAPAAPPPVPPNEASYCATAAQQLTAAVAVGGVCAACTSNVGTATGGATGCATACPGCINSLLNWAAACSSASVLPPAAATVAQLAVYGTQLLANSVVKSVTGADTGGDCMFAFVDYAAAWGTSAVPPANSPWGPATAVPKGAVIPPTCLRVSIQGGTTLPYISLPSVAINGTVGTGTGLGGDIATYSLIAGQYVVNAAVVDATGTLSSPTGAVTDTLQAYLTFSLAAPTAAALATLVAPPPPPPLLGSVTVSATLQLQFVATALVQPTLAAATAAIASAVSAAMTPVAIGGTAAGATASNVRLTCQFAVAQKAGDGSAWPPDWTAAGAPRIYENLAAVVFPLSAGTASLATSDVVATGLTLTLTLAGIADAAASNLMPLAAAACPPTPPTATAASQLWFNQWFPGGVSGMQLVATSVALMADVNITAGVAQAGSHLAVAAAVVGALNAAALSSASPPFPAWPLPTVQRVCLTAVDAATQCQPTVGLLTTPVVTPVVTPAPAPVVPFVLPPGLVVPATGVPPGPALSAAAVTSYLTSVSTLATSIAAAAAAPGGTVDAAAVTSGLSALAAVSASAAPAALQAENVNALANITASLLTAATSGPAGTTLSAANVGLALGVLTQVAAAGTAVSAAVATNVVAGLSILVAPTTAVLDAAGTAEVLGRAGAAVSALATSMAAAPSTLCAAGAGASTASAPGIAVSVECNAPVFSAGLSMPGSAAAVAPLPANIFGGGTALGAGPGSSAAPPAQLVSTFYALSFDPHGGAASDPAAPAVTSVVRLQFHDADTGAELVVANLPQPIQMTLPSSITPAAGRRSLRAAGDPATPSVVVRFWDTNASAYSTAGIVTLPNPAPAGAVLSWRANFSAGADADLPLAWALELPGCTELVLNCSDAWERTLAISLDPEENIGDDVVTCGDETSAAEIAAAGLMRVFIGASCPLWRPASETGCSWDIPSQAFVGTACVYASTAQMGTRHTTDFGVGSAPRLAIASPADLVALGPSVLRQLRLLITLLVCLFGGMHILALGVNVRDQRDMHKALARARSAALGCSHAGGLHLWRFTQEPLPLGAPLGRVRGSAVEFSALVGFPHGRFALALPSELFGGAQLRHATGKISGASATALRRHHDVLLQTITRGEVAARKGEPEAAAPAESPTAEEAAQYELDEVELATRSIKVDAHPTPDLLQISSTALMHAFLQSWCLQSSADVLLQQRLYIELLTLTGVDPGGVMLTRLFSTYKDLLMGHIAHPTGWFLSARVFRCVLLAQEGRSWEATDALAASLQACDAGGAASEEVPPRRGFQLVRDLVQSVVSAVALGGISGLNQDTAAGTAAGLYENRRRDAAATKADAAEKEREQKRIESLTRASEGGGDGGDEDADDPLHYSATALLRTVPASLAARFADDAAMAQRVWATACACTFLQAQVLGWLSSQEHDAPRTLVDDAGAWLHETMGDGELHAAVDAAAHAAVARWAARHDALVSRSRAAHIASRYYAVSEAQRASCAVVNALVNRSPTISMLASFYSVGTRRWMNAFMLVSVVLASLLVELWLWWSRSLICCGDAREVLGCARDDAEPCRGFDGTCAELALTHAPFAAASLLPDGSARARPLPACAAFPDGSARDTFAAAVIAAACALPVATLVSTLFNTSVATDSLQQHGRTRLLKWPLWARIAIGRADWRFAPLGARDARVRRTVGRWWATKAATDILVALIDAVTACLTACGVRPPAPPPGLEPAPPGGKAPPAVDDAALVEALSFDAMTTRARYAAFGVLYAFWAIFSWLAIVYGSLIYAMLGRGAEENFVRSFAGSIGLGQLADLREFGKTTLYMVVLVALLDALWVMPNVRWLETHLDFASVQASSLRRRTGAVRGRWITYLRHNKAIA